MTGRRTAQPGAVMLLRLALLAAVLGGLFGMHVLTAGHDAGHGTLPTAGHAAAMPAGTSGAHSDALAAPTAAREMDEPSGHPVQVAVAAPVAAAAPMGMGTDAGAACVLFLSFGAALIGLALSRRRVSGATVDHGLWRRQMLLSLRRRGPPSSPPHDTLCVIRV